MGAGTAPAGPWGGPALKTVLAAIRKGWPAGLTVLTGDDLYHLDRGQAALLDHLAPDRETAFGVSIVGDEPISTEALVGLARSAGMFASRRVVFLRDVSNLQGEPEPLVAYASQPGTDSFVIVRAPRLDRKRKLHKALADAGTCVAFRVPANEAELKALGAEMTGMASARGVTLERDAANLLIDVFGPDLNRIASELDKLSVWSGAGADVGRPLDAKNVRDLIAGSEILTGWELADALTARDPAEATAAARRLLDSGDEPIRILGGLASRARSLLRAKALTEAGAPLRSVIDETRAWYFKDALVKGLSRYTMAELLDMPGRFLEADRSFKSRALDKGAVLETLVSGLTAPASESR
jgi:DNA polymerase-3 subunit delta